MTAFPARNHSFPRLSFRPPRLRTSSRSLRQALDFLLPRHGGYGYIRVGPDADGGYVLPADLEGIAACFSPGVDNRIGFELDLFNRFAIPSHLCDHADKRPSMPEVFSYDDHWLSVSTGPGQSTLADWVQRRRPHCECDWMLQMDIEAAEWPVLAGAPAALLNRFRIVIVELHVLSRLRSWRRFVREVVPLFDRLSRSHYVAYLHANNCHPGTRDDDGLLLPEVLEVTLHRRDRIRAQPAVLEIPTYLDFDCVPGRAGVDFFSSWLSFLGMNAGSRFSLAE